MELEKHVAIVTGAGRGIGRATALELARMGADIVVAELDQAGANEDREMMTDGGLAPPHRLREIASTHFPAWRVGDEAEQAKTNRIRQHLETGGQRLRIGAAYRIDQQRRATLLDELHASTLACIDSDRCENVQQA